MVLQKKRLGYGSRGRQGRAAPRVPTLAPGKRSTRRKKNEMYALDLLATVAGTLSADQEDLSSRPDINGTAASYTTIRRSVKSEQFDDVAAFNSAATIRRSVKSEQFDDVPALHSSATIRRSVKSEQFDDVPAFNSVTTIRRSIKSEQFDDVPAFSRATLRKGCCKGCTVGCAGTCAFLRQNKICSAENSPTQNVADTMLESLTEKPDVFVKGSSVPEYGTIGVCHPWFAEVKQVHQARPTIIRSQVDCDSTTLHSSVDTMDMDTNPPSVVSSDGSSGVHLGGHDRGHNSSPFCSGEVHHAAYRDGDENSSGCVQPSISGSKGDYLPHYIGDCRTRRLSATRFRKAARNKICGEMSNKGSKLNFCGNKTSTTRRRAQLQRRMCKTKRLADCYFAQPSDEGVLSETSRTSFCMGDQDPSCASEGYHVKLTIKSFNVPELFIKIPDNATVGSLKKIVTDAITTAIEGNLRVGVLFQGKIIQDDKKMLRQAGICHGEKLDNIGFTVECEAERDSHPSVITPEEADSVGASVVEPLSMIKCEEPLPENVDELAIVPPSRSNQSGIGQRRKRTPFSVAEVEALVEAVEQFGTGRWSDVRFYAFGTAGHRTYVDMKDKWKNLVRTARLPPQLRRGKAIPPQELLDRVLAAQAFWSLQQA